MSVLNEWYEINVGDKVAHKDNYYKDTSKMLDEYEYIKSKLSDEDCIHLDLMVQIINEMGEKAGFEKFEFGFRQGVMLMNEIFKDDVHNNSLLLQFLKSNEND